MVSAQADETLLKEFEQRTTLIEKLAFSLDQQLKSAEKSVGRPTQSQASMTPDFQASIIKELQEIRKNVISERRAREKIEKELSESKAEKELLATKNSKLEYRINHLMREFPEPAFGRPQK
eukprot:67348_1